MAWYLKGICQQFLGNDWAALTSYTVCVALHSEFAWPYRNRGELYYKLGQTKPAFDDYERANVWEPRRPQMQMDLALAKRKIKDVAGAERDLTAVLDAHPNEVRALLIRHEMRLELRGREAEAKADLEKGLALEPQDDKAWSTRGFYRMTHGSNDREAKKARGKEALTDFEHALELNPRCISALLNKTYVKAELLNDNEGAIEAISKVIEFYADYLPARAGRGVLLARLGGNERLALAFKDADICLVFDSSAYCRYQIGSLYALASKHDPKYKEDALRLLGESLRLGLNRLDLFTTDSDLDPIRQDPEFHR